MLTAWFRLIYATVFGVALTNLFSVLLLLGGANYLTVVETDDLRAQALLSLDVFGCGVG